MREQEGWGVVRWREKAEEGAGEAEVERGGREDT